MACHPKSVKRAHQLADSHPIQPNAPVSRPIPWLFVIGLLILYLGLVASQIYLGAQASFAELKQNERRRNTEEFTEVRGGKTKASVSSPELVVMFAGDQACIQNLTSLYFFMSNLSDPRYAEIAKLSNLEDIGVYSCDDVHTFFTSIKGMPSIKSIYMESVTLDERLLRTLSSFPNLQKVQFEQLLSYDQIALLAKELPSAIVEVTDPVSGKPKRIQGGTP